MDRMPNPDFEQRFQLALELNQILEELGNIKRQLSYKKSENDELEKNINNIKNGISTKENELNKLIADNEVLEKEPELIEYVGSGIAEINNDVFFCDLPDDGEYRAYISVNKKELNRNHEIYLRLKKYTVELKEIFD